MRETEGREAGECQTEKKHRQTSGQTERDAERHRE